MNFLKYLLSKNYRTEIARQYSENFSKNFAQADEEVEKIYSSLHIAKVQDETVANHILAKAS